MKSYKYIFLFLILSRWPNVCACSTKNAWSILLIEAFFVLFPIIPNKQNLVAKFVQFDNANNIIP